MVTDISKAIAKISVLSFTTKSYDSSLPYLNEPALGVTPLEYFTSELSTFPVWVTMVTGSLGLNSPVTSMTASLILSSLNKTLPDISGSPLSCNSGAEPPSSPLSAIAAPQSSIQELPDISPPEILTTAELVQ